MSTKKDRKTKGWKPAPPRRGSGPMTSEEALSFIRNMQKAFPKRPRTKAEKEALRNYLAQFKQDLLRAVGQRVQADLMQRPPITVDPKDFPKEPKPRQSERRPSERRPSSRKKPRR